MLLVSLSDMSDSLGPHGLQYTRLSYPFSWSLLKLLSIELVMLSNRLILCCPLLLLPSIFLCIRACSNESTLCIRWPKYWSFRFSISPSNAESGLISFRMDWFDLCHPSDSQESSPAPQFKNALIAQLVKNPPAMQRPWWFNSGSGRSSGEGIGYPFQYSWASLVAQLVKNPPAMQEIWVWSLGWEDPLEKGKSTHSSIPAWKMDYTVHGIAKSWTLLSNFHFQPSL